MLQESADYALWNQLGFLKLTTKKIYGWSLDAIKLVETESSKYLSEDLTLLDGNMTQVNYVDGLTYVFISQWDKFKIKRRLSRVRLTL